MKNSFIFACVFILSIYICENLACAEPCFSIKSVRYYNEATPTGCKILKKRRDYDGKMFTVPKPFIEAKVSVNSRILFTNIIAKAYYYDSANQLVEISYNPSRASRPEFGTFDIPTYFEKNKVESIFFEIPDSVQRTKDWTFLIVFGDSYEIATASSSALDVSKLNFTEKNILVNKRNTTTIRKDAKKELIELTIKNSTEAQSKISLILRLPKSKTIQGLCAVCLLADSVEDIKKDLLFPPSYGELNDVLEFADRYEMAVVCWGSKSLWNRTKNWTEQGKEEYKNYDKTFDTIASSWYLGVNKLCKAYAIPSDNILLWGTSGAAQYAMRLALRCPTKFLAACIHIPSSFDMPTKQGNNILWCLTTGELEPGYNRSLEFYKESTSKYDYSIIYKAFIGLGHLPSPISNKMRLAVWEYALTQQKVRDKLRWKEIMNSSPYYGDIINQRIIRGEELDKFRDILLTPLPTKDLKTIWEMDIHKF